ncbi:MAG TPA: DUF1963 domain-containing protein [Pyrinomonadaceae bacterium]|nr:DUF1963 domain-containing protein [Pyrinomonadaceae bacterium]
MNIPPELQEFKRSAWKPIVQDGNGLPIDSKFAGTPFIKQDEDYPVCPNCNNPLQLFLQLDLEKLPEKLGDKFGHGLLQFFYCTNSEPLCESDCEAYFPFAKSVLIRILKPENLTNPKENSFSGSFPPKTITGWQEMEDFPNWEEGEDLLHIGLTEEQWDKVNEDGYPHGGDKLSGYPMWIQSIEYPDCPICGKRMRLLFQIDSEDNIPYSFGDVGCGHLTQCEEHKEQLAFGWACS